MVDAVILVFAWMWGELVLPPPDWWSWLAPLLWARSGGLVGASCLEENASPR